jgi:RNA polymerase-binding protein DksA
MEDLRITAARRTLLERRRQLLRRTSTSIDGERALIEEREADREDQASHETAARLRLLDRMTETELMQLDRVQAALDRIDAGTYGMCVTCGSPILWARLKVVPETARCSDCTDSH